MTIRELSPDLAEIAKRDLNEDPKRRDADILAIREWLKKQPHLPSKLDDQWILTFLRGCKFSLERTKQKLDMYYTSRALVPAFYKNRDPFSPEIQEILNLDIIVPLPQPDPKGRRVIIMRIGTYEPDKILMDNINKLSFMNMDLNLRDNDRSVIAGEIAILDMKGARLAHAAQMTPAVVKRMMTISQEAYPMRPQGLHYFNAPPGAETFFNMFKSFMNKKLQDRLYVHGSDVETLYQILPKEHFPEEYGGQAGTCKEIAAVWRKKLEANKDWFKEQEKFVANESKRPGKPKTENDLFGLEGSFRQLSVD